MLRRQSNLSQIVVSVSQIPDHEHLVSFMMRIQFSQRAGVCVLERVGHCLFERRNRRNSLRRFEHVLVCCFGMLLGLVSLSQTQADEPTAMSSQLEFFEKEVRPLFAQHCYSCHSVDAKKIQAGLLMDSRSSLLTGGDSGEAMVPGDVDGSLLIEAVRYESYEMPPKGKLSDKDIHTLERWVEMGAPWPEEDAPTGAELPPEFDLASRAADHWVWQPIQSPAIPDVVDDQWPRDDLDRFVLAKLEEATLVPAGDTDRAALMRRLYFDLIGLPPDERQATAFLNAPSPLATERLVDELLDSPHFGERWGRHWLDLVRYAESRGHEFDNDTPNAFQYRDYIIRALNADVPYDQLIREHIAGDLVAEPRMHPEKHFNESILGTGFWYLGEWVHSPVDIRKDESDRFDNMIDVMSKTFLGVTVSCARCHDHKFDAISTADYYSLCGFLQSSDYRQVRFESIEQNRQVAESLASVDEKYQRQIRELLESEGVGFPRQMSFLDDKEIIADYSNLPAKDFMQDGFIFGPNPLRAGQAHLDVDDSSGVRIATHGAAVNDLFWNGLESLSEGGMQDRGELSKLPKSGRTLRTPTFELSGETVSCLVEGTGHVLACVDSHRMIAGPLHKETIKPIDAASEGWVTLNLKRYIGHRMHLEFVPAQDKLLSVRIAVQGLGRTELAEFQQRLNATNQPFERYATAATEILRSRGEIHREVFADFESGNYEGWTATGDAFGQTPQTLDTIAGYQGRINAKGKYFVNSHNVREGENVSRGDRFTGTLTSRSFEVSFDAIEFLIGGGAHQGQTCVNLIIDGKPVRSATGRSNNQMSLNTWDVRPFAGKDAQIQIVDNHTSGWGNIGVDHIVFLSGSGATVKSTAADKIVDAWRRERRQLSKQVVRESRLALAMMDGTGEDERVLIRGNSSKPGEVEPRHFLTAVAGNQPMPIERGSGRLELANQINDPNNPLTSRVIVNRIWHYLIGRGIVPTTDDFGVLGQRPTHPELLDHLANRFVADGHSIKQMIRSIVLSRTYQMSSQPDPAAVAADPKNLLWHHRPPKRLEGESIRDAMLSISGRLDKTQFGEPVPIHLTGFMDGRGRPGKSGPLDGDGRRSIYISVRRNFLSPFMTTFDTPTPFSTMGRRNVSNVPAQALILMNDPLVLELMNAWAQKAIETHSNIESRVRWMYQNAFARQPDLKEQAVAMAYLTNQMTDNEVAENDLSLWTNFAHALVNTKEFIFLK